MIEGTGKKTEEMMEISSNATIRLPDLTFCAAFIDYTITDGDASYA